MKPTWTSRRPAAISASMIRWQASRDGASGFSQNTGLPAAIAARACSSCAGPQDATSTASTLPSAISSRAVGEENATGTHAAPPAGGGKTTPPSPPRRRPPGPRPGDAVDGGNGPAGEHLSDPADVVL